jgi:hypothetical protein
MKNLAQSSNLRVNHVNMATYDFDLHGTVSIRLINAGPSDLAAVKRQLGPIQSVLTREPDIVIRFVDHMQLSSSVRYIGVEDAGFTEDAFLILRGKYQTSIKVQIPFDQIGSRQCEIVCESGVPAVPLLIAIINLTALSKGVLPLHASALLYNGKGVLITGWSKGGKTETLLAFAANGATYVGDEWIYLSPDGERMYGIPEPTRVWYWHLQEMPRYKAMVNRKDLRRLQALHLFAKILKRLEFSPLKRRANYLQALKRLTALVQRQLYVQLPPEKLFGQKAEKTDVSPEKIFFLVSHDQPDVTVQPIDSQELAERMVFSLQEERIELLSYYFKYRFAFPECSNPLIDQAEEIQRRLMLRAFANKEAYAIYHPYPFSIPSLFDIIRPYCD